MNNSPKKLAGKILIKNRINSAQTLNTLQNLISDNGFTIIEYNRYNNTRDVNALIKQLDIENMISSKDSFVFLSDNIKLVFVNTDLSVEDKTILLRHELGHICDPHINLPNHIYSKIKREDFANEFSYHLEHPSFIIKMVSTFLRHKLPLILAFFLIVISSLGVYAGYSNHTSRTLSVYNVDTASEVFYITPSGEKYHKEFCKHVKYRNNASQILLNDATSNGYSPCLDCIGE